MKLTRRMRIWEKKRGSRRTGSKLVGTVGEALFSATLFVLGGVSLTVLLASQAIAIAQPYQPGFGFWVMVLVSSSFMLLGCGGVILTAFQAGVSPERRSVFVRRAGEIDLSGDVDAAKPRLPNIPSAVNLMNSPGVRQRFRLPVVQSPAWRLVFATLFCLIWNVSAVILVVVAASSFFRNQPEWFLTIFILPFLVIGGWAIYDFVRQWLRHAGVGPTNVEISEHPLYPGEMYSIYLSQAGRLSMQAISVNLVCEEAATFRQGTDIRTEQRRVFDRQLYRKSEFEIMPGEPFEHDLKIEIPPDAMHSFQSEHNAINWMLVVRGVAESWPPFERSFPLIVYPSHGNHQTADRTADRAEAS